MDLKVYDKCFVFQVQGQLCFCSMVCLLMAPTGSQTWITTALALCWQMQAMMYGWETAEGIPGPGNIYTSQWSKKSSGFLGILIFADKLSVLFVNKFLSFPVTLFQLRCGCTRGFLSVCALTHVEQIKGSFMISVVSWDGSHRWSVGQ